jgi:hypothetical protein
MRQLRLESNVGPVAHAQKRSSVGGVYIGNEFSGFGVGIMQIALAKLCNTVVSPRLIGEGAVNQSMLRKWPAYSSRDMVCSRSSLLSVSCSDTEHDSLRWERKSDLIEHSEDLLVNSAHPRYPRGH